jgi:hypothetical protein
MNMEFENNLLKVDDAFYSPRLPGHVVIRIGDDMYMLRGFTTRKPTEADLRAYKSPTDKSWRKPAGYEYLMCGLMPRNGFDVEAGRPITADEFKAIITEYGLGDDDISKEFEDTLGAIFGDKYAKKHTSRQIQVPENKAIPMERELQAKGIQANNVAPGRVNIRTDWGGYREGAGRPASGKKKRNYYVADDEDAKIKDLIASLRQDK